MHSDRLSHLNPQQRKAVTAGLGQVLVLAGPGSGKTRVLTERIAYLIRDLGARPYTILAVTFTNKAAREMQSRVEKILEARPDEIWLGTFHAVCARLLRREAQYLPFESNFVIMDSDDQETLVKRVIKELNLNDKQYRPASIHAAISNAKNAMLEPKDYPKQSYRDEVVARVYERYNQLLVENNAVDFDDLLLWAVRVLQENPEVREKYARRFEHVLVDEFQDTNMVQYKLLKLLSSYHNNLFVVGDEDQSIYRWRGADYKNVLRFEEDFPQAEKILLEQNYRSTQTVLNAARAVIDRNPYRTPKRLFTDRGDGDKIDLYEANDDHAEAAFVVDTISQGLSRVRGSGGQFAVMYRTNAQSRLLEEAFLRSGLPYRLVGAQRFYGRREVKDLIGFLRMVANPSDEISLARVINVPPRGIGDKTLLGLQLAAQKHKSSPGAALLDLGKNADKSPYWKEIGRGAISLADFGHLLNGWLEAVRVHSLPAGWTISLQIPHAISLQVPRIKALPGIRALSLPALFDRILSDVGYEKYILDGSEEGNDRWENVQELRKLAYEKQDGGLIEFLENLALVSDQDTLPEESSAPTLLTLHAAKGLEFDQVFIIGLDEGILPHSRSFEDPEEMAEERRLLYVGMTRARNRLYLVRSRQRTTFGMVEDSEQSRFLDDIPDALLRVQGTRRSSSRYDTLWDAPQRQSRKDTYLSPGYSEQETTYSKSTSSTKGKTSPASSSFSASTARNLHPAGSSYPEQRPMPSAPVPIVQQRYHPAMRVRHPIWGEGMVINSRLQDNDEVVEVFFEQVGSKRLVASLAKLDII